MYHWHLFFQKEKLGPNLVENITNLITKLRYLVNSRVTLSFLYIETSVDVQIERSRLDGGQKLIFAVEMEMYILVIIKKIYTHEYIYLKVLSNNCLHTYIYISSLVEFQRWWVLKSKIFGQESKYSKDFFFQKIRQ